MLMAEGASIWRAVLDVSLVVIGIPVSFLALRKFRRGKGRPARQPQEAKGSGNVLIQTGDGSPVHVSLERPEEERANPVPPLSLTAMEIRLLKVAQAHQGLLPLLLDHQHGRRTYVGPFGNEALEIDRELEHLVEMELFRRESSTSSTIKFRLTSAGWNRLDHLLDGPSLADELIVERRKEAREE